MLIIKCDKCGELVEYVRANRYQTLYCNGDKYCTCKKKSK